MLKFYKYRKSGTALTLLMMLCSLGKTIYAQTSYSTGFEPPAFTVGDVNGQNGWGYLSNSPTKGIIEAAPAESAAAFGSQSLAIRTNDVGFSGFRIIFFQRLSILREKQAARLKELRSLRLTIILSHRSITRRL